jgi:hypothetical protein
MVKCILRNYFSLRVKRILTCLGDFVILALPEGQNYVRGSQSNQKS